MVNITLDGEGMKAMQKISNPMAAASDDRLVEQAQAGDAGAFGELMRRHSRASYKVALGILRDPHEAEDEVQNAYWKAFQHIGSFEREAKFSTWITRIVMNQCLMRLRQLRRARFLYLDDAPAGEERGAMELPDLAETPESGLVRKEMARKLHQEIRRIPPLLRHALVLREVSELPMQEVAARLGISVAAAKSRLLRARHELRSRMEKHYGMPLAAA